jgi:hypothetical protein
MVTSKNHRGLINKELIFFNWYSICPEICWYHHTSYFIISCRQTKKQEAEIMLGSQYDTINVLVSVHTSFGALCSIVQNMCTTRK